MSPHTPAVFPALVTQIVVTQDLGVVVVRLEGGVVDVWRPGTLEEEEAVVVYQLVATVETEEDGYVFAFVIVHQLEMRLICCWGDIYGVVLTSLG